MMICNEISHVHLETGENKLVSKIDLNLKSSTPIGQCIKSCGKTLWAGCFGVKSQIAEMNCQNSKEIRSWSITTKTMLHTYLNTRWDLLCCFDERRGCVSKRVKLVLQPSYLSICAYSSPCAILLEQLWFKEPKNTRPTYFYHSCY